ncbi:hypothetical protein [Desulfocurvibacter africanus]|uniref:Uncharacterized protein n=1 Tax=Desulfocurvibacter africanus subsp. africanus str. Walvis Bay TaxID=690850 RepID=F3YW05_DESAF|nr:hypothetical protein [Desulfocurvibacter africanus]EGJ49035.1 hypothetical protein Desaf_0683 [Desulfocurvibacter africanus subsp. africanus str. Walvis Bay]
MDFAAWKFWLDLGQTLLLLGLGLYTFLTARDRVTHDKIDVLDTRLDGMDTRLTKTETDNSHAPSRSDLGKLSNDIQDLTKIVGNRFSDHDSRLARVEVACSKAPDHGSLSKVYDRINAVDSKVGEVAAQVNDQGGELRAIRKQLELINQYLLNKGSKQ